MGIMYYEAHGERYLAVRDIKKIKEGLTCYQLKTNTSLLRITWYIIWVICFAIWWGSQTWANHHLMLEWIGKTIFPRLTPGRKCSSSIVEIECILTIDDLDCIELYAMMITAHWFARQNICLFDMKKVFFFRGEIQYHFLCMRYIYMELRVKDIV